MADLTYSVGVNTQGAQQNLQKLQGQIQQLNNSFSGLKTAISGLAIGAFIGNAMKMANAMADLSAATGVSLKTINGFSDALIRNGGSAQAAQDGIAKLQLAIQGALSGSKEMRTNFTELGISMDDLRNKSSEEVLGKVVEGLGSVATKSEAATKGMKIFGESFKTVDFRGVSSGFAGYVSQASQSARAMEVAAQANQNLTNLIKVLQTEVLVAIEPFTRLAAAMTDNEGAIRKWMATALQIGTVVAGLTVVGKAWGILRGAVTASTAAVGAASATWSAGMGAMTAAGQTFGKTVSVTFWQFFKKLPSEIARGVAPFKAFAETIAVFAAKRLPYFVAAFKTAFATIGTVLVNTPWGRFAAIGITALTALYQVAKNFFGDTAIGKGIVELGQKLLQSIGLMETAAQEAARVSEQVAADQAAANEQAAAAALKVATAYQEQTKALKTVQTALSDAFAEQNSRYQLETNLIGATERQREVATAVLGLEEERRRTVAELEKEYRALQEAAKDSGDSEAAAKAKAVREAIAQINQQYDEQKEKVAVLLQQREEMLNMHEAEAQLLEMQNYMLEQRNKGEEAVLAIRHEMENLTMSEGERRLADVDRLIAREKKLAIEKRKAQLGVTGELELAEVKAIEDQIEAAYSGLRGKTQELLDKSRSFETGWKKAMKTYVDEATNGAKKAESIFNKAFQGMEDLLVNFAKTGKFEWKQFVAMMLEELLRAQIQAVFASMIGDMSGAMNNSMGGVGGMLGGLFGGGKGGSGGGIGDVLGGAWDTVSGWFGGGSKQPSGWEFGPGNRDDQKPAAGGGVWDTVKSVGSSAWDAVSSVGSGVWDTVKSVGSGVWDAVSSVGSAIGDFFGGFFADGGRLGAGKWGIAGEAGPEIIHGPANITPMKDIGGGSTNVTYNINAVDARSFKQLIASDPAFIHGIVMAGAKGIPARR